MTREQIVKVLAARAQQYADKRLFIFDVRLEGESKLAGRVLEQRMVDELHADLPGVDLSAVRVLRGERPVYQYVATNLTDLHTADSFIAEMLTQVLNGTRLEILEEKEKWAIVRQDDGYIGWAYRPYLTPSTPPEATHRVIVPTAPILSEPSDAAMPLTAHVVGSPVHVAEIRDNWAKVSPSGALSGGWTSLSHLRPISLRPAPPDVARRQLVADARRMTGVYYLWGGGSAWGFDCSGLAQAMHRLSGYTLPRDCDMQFAAGKPVEPPFRPGDLIFFQETGRKKVTHVGISTGGWNCIHCSRGRNGVYEENVQETESLRSIYAGGRSFVNG